MSMLKLSNVLFDRKGLQRHIFSWDNKQKLLMGSFCIFATIAFFMIKDHHKK